MNLARFKSVAARRAVIATMLLPLLLKVVFQGAYFSGKRLLQSALIEWQRSI